MESGETGMIPVRVYLHAALGWVVSTFFAEEDPSDPTKCEWCYVPAVVTAKIMGDTGRQGTIGACKACAAQRPARWRKAK